MSKKDTYADILANWDKVEIDFKGHCDCPSLGKDYLHESITDYFKRLSLTDYFERLKSEREHAEWASVLLKMPFTVGKPLGAVSPQQCGYCGEYVKHIYAGDYKIYLSEKPCSCSKGRAYSGELNIKSKLVFANFFRSVEDSPKDLQYSDKYSLNSEAGIRNITKYKASQGVAYGQLCNTSIALYINEDRTSIIVGPAYHPAEFEDYETEKEFKEAIRKPLFKGYKKIRNSNISCDVWRFEAADISTVRGEVKKFKTDEKDFRDMVEVKVPKGDWKFKVYFDTRTPHFEKNPHMWARFDLKKKKKKKKK